MSTSSPTAPVAPAGLKQTALAAAHLRSGARMVDFGGWWMPVQYSGILPEHLAVRQACGIFDISHMGQFFLRGEGTLDLLDETLTNDPRKLGPGQGQYTFMLNESGGVIDDLIVYRLPDASEGDYLAVVNAGRLAEDEAWLRPRAQAKGVALAYDGSGRGGLALQGPKALAVLAKLAGAGWTAPTRNMIARLEWQGEAMWVARTGYTGEDGVEIFFPAAIADKLWDTLLQTGADEGLLPCGLGARDTLRLEMGYPLNGNDLSFTHSPLEAGLGVFVAEKRTTDFPGKKLLTQQRQEGVTRKLVAFKMEGKGAPPRAHYPLHVAGEEAPVGEVTSGSHSPSLGLGIGMGYVPAALAAPGQKLEVGVRGARLAAVVVKKPIYLKNA